MPLEAGSTVWAVMWDWYEESCIVSTWTTKALAEQEVERINNERNARRLQHWKMGNFIILPLRLDEEWQESQHSRERAAARAEAPPHAHS